MRNFILVFIFFSLASCNHTIDKKSEKLLRLALDTINVQTNSKDTLDSIVVHRLLIANTLLDSAIRLDSLNINAYYWQTHFLTQLKNFSSAYGTCDKGIEKSNGQKNYMIASLHIQRGLLNLRLNNKDINNDFTVALDWFESQIKKDNSNLDAIMNKALILCYMDKKDEAIEYLYTIHNGKIEQKIPELIAQIKDFKVEKVITK